MTQDNNGSTYGGGAYNQSLYSEQCANTSNCVTTVESIPNSPNTGLIQQPVFLIPAALILAVLIVAVEFFVRRTFAKRKRAASNATESTQPRQ